jgi:hypothetical protein
MSLLGLLLKKSETRFYYNKKGNVKEKKVVNWARII